MTPRVLTDWTEAAIVEALTKGLFESEDFDFKEKLPDPRDHPDKSRLRGSCVAFANAGGGFLVFGVANDRTLSPAQRLVGLDPSFDFPEHFGGYPGLCVPAVDWSFRNPAIALVSGRLIHVVHIPRSWKAPHAVGSADDGWRFLKRTNKGNEGMNIDEVRSAFLSFYEKRLRLQLLRAELETIRRSALEMILDPSDRDKKYHLTTFDLTIVESVLADTYPLTSVNPDFLSRVSQLRSKTRVANNKIKIFFGIAEFPLSNKNALVLQHNEFMASTCAEIAALASEAERLLDEILKP